LKELFELIFLGAVEQVPYDTDYPVERKRAAVDLIFFRLKGVFQNDRVNLMIEEFSIFDFTDIVELVWEKAKG
jgi:hypothetical protein